MDDKLKQLLTRALGTAKFASVTEVGADWMLANQVWPFVNEDPAVIWLNYYGALEGFYPDNPPYGLTSFLSVKKRQFREKWVMELAPASPSVCQTSYDIYQADSMQATCQLMLMGVPVIVLPALWCADEKVFGKPDLIVHTSWLQTQLKSRILSNSDSDAMLNAPAPALGSAGAQGHYVAANLVFSTNLGAKRKAQTLAAYEAQTRIQTYILGKLQGYMPLEAYLITRDKPTVLRPVPTRSTLNDPLDVDLKEMRDTFIEIKLRGKDYRPWRDAIVANNPKNDVERWASAKAAIAMRAESGVDPRILPNVGAVQKEGLADKGYATLRSLLEASPEQLQSLLKPRQVKGIGEKKGSQLHAILTANRIQKPVRPPVAQIPPPREFEFYVDFEFFSNLDVDFDQEWPVLTGRKQVFMIGVGWQENGVWHSPPQIFGAKAETVEAEREMFDAFLDFLQAHTGSAYLDPARTAIYHWSNAEQTQAEDVANRHKFAPDHPLRRLPWQDLRTIFLDGPAAVPGAWAFGLKEVAKALGHLDSQYDPQWVGDLDDGLGAMVLGWQIYADQRKLATETKLRKKEREVLETHVREGWEVLESYLTADCQALYQVLRWLRAGQEVPQPDPSAAPYVGWNVIRQTFPTEPQQAYAGLNAGKGVVVYGQPVLDKEGGKLPVNQLVWGDELLVLEERANWRKIRARGTVGWVHKTLIQLDPLLEVNFVDVGQGDGCFIVTPERKYLLVDAGPGDNLYRFLHWYFAYFKTEVTFDAAIITHPDSDHYAGFGKLFDAKDPTLQNVRFRRIYHNGILDAGSEDAFAAGVVADFAVLKAALPGKTGNFPRLLKKAIASGRIDEPEGIHMLYAPRSGIGWLEGYEPQSDGGLQIQVLGPVPESDGPPPELAWYGDEGKTKNGNSILLRLLYNNVSILLGGDLNVPAEEHLLAHYGTLAVAENHDITSEQRIANAYDFLGSDIAKSCHHGSSDFTTEFLQAINPVATVISSGDDESYGHPRPDTLGALGHFSRIDRPLIFSTELARSAPEQIKHPSELRRGLIAAHLQEQESEFAEELVQSLGRSVAVYGMICLRTDGHNALFAQKLEKPGSKARKWDLHLLEPDEQGKLTYRSDEEG